MMITFLMASPRKTSSDSKKLKELLYEGFGFVASVIAIFAFLGISIVSVTIVLLVFLGLVIIYLLNENRRLQKEVKHLRSENNRMRKVITKRGSAQKEKPLRTATPPPVRKKATVASHPKPKEMLPDILPKKTPPDKAVLHKKFGLPYEEYKEYPLDLQKTARVRIHAEATECINVYFLDKWHFDRIETWDKAQWMDTSVYEYDETFVIPKAGKWFIICEALDQPADVVLTATIIEEGEEEKPRLLRMHKV
ncbi:MAG: hypothetical protein ACXABY_04820 [Candidatus Thorarchaeota archaeon]|jgi:hypothetical protein